MEYARKKLLILGGNPETGALVAVANALGVHTIVVDPNPNAPAKRFAAEKFHIDGFDVEAIVRLAKGLDVDGVLVGVADILVDPYRRVCERLRLPCYATKDVVDAFCSKDGFRAACGRFGVRDIPGLVIRRGETTSSALMLGFPIMVKPVDSGAGVGMRVCTSAGELDECVSAALAHSRRGEVIVERYMTADDMFAYFTFCEGSEYLSAIADRITSKAQGSFSPVCLAALYPSRHAHSFVEKAVPGLSRMFRGLGVRNGVLNIQFFVDGTEFFAYDPGFRLQGEAPHIPLSVVNGFDHREMLVHFALTGAMRCDDLSAKNDYLLHGKRACTLWLLLKDGVIKRIDGFDTVRADPCVVFVLQRFESGDEVTPDMVGTERQVLARIYIVADSASELADRVAKFRATIRVVDENDADMIVDWLNPDLLFY